MKLISHMRDMLVTVPDHGQQKLNAVYVFGSPELLMETIKENFGLYLSFYRCPLFSSPTGIRTRFFLPPPAFSIHHGHKNTFLFTAACFFIP